MKNVTKFLLSSLLACSACQENDPAMMSVMDQAASGGSDMLSTSMPDAADPNAPGLVKYTYSCDDAPAVTVELPRVRFGAKYDCRIENESFFIHVTDDRVPTELRFGMSNYRGPGTYSFNAEVFSGVGFSNCRWPSNFLTNGNCKALKFTTISSCCRDDAEKRVLKCSLTVIEHTAARVQGSFECSVIADDDGPNRPFICPFRSKADFKGSFDFGPKDCQ